MKDNRKMELATKGHTVGKASVCSVTYNDAVSETGRVMKERTLYEYKCH